MTTTEHIVPYVPAEIIDGHLVRVCPDCKQRIGERTDDDGLVSNHFAAHHEAEHHKQEPPKQRVYVLGNERFPQLDRSAFQQARKALGDEVDLTLVPAGDIMKIPEGEDALFVGDIIVAGFTNDPDDRDIRWYAREGDKIVFQPTKRQADRLSASHRRLDEVFEAVKADAERVGARGLHAALLKLIVAEMKLQNSYFEAGRWKATKAAAAVAHIEARRLDVNERIEHAESGLCAATTKAGKLCSHRAVVDGLCRRHADAERSAAEDEVA